MDPKQRTRSATTARLLALAALAPFPILQPQQERTPSPPSPPSGTEGDTLPVTSTPPPRSLHSSSATSFWSSTPCSDTPMAKSSQTAAKGDNIEDQKAVLEEELRHNIVEAGESFVHDLYDGVASQAQVDKFLKSSKLYSSRKKVWKDIPIGAPEKDLYAPLGEIFDSILTHFGLAANRLAVFTGKRRVRHHEGEEGTDHSSSPDFMVKGLGDSLDPRVKLKNHGNFLNVVNPLEIKTEAEKNRNHIPQVAVYSRQCFSSQLSRHFVRVLLITDRSARLYHFDRSGAQYSQYIDIHGDPATFVRMFLGVSTLDESALGFDTSIIYTKSSDGKVSRTLTTVDQDKKKITYRIRDTELPFSRRSVRGRGTVCWPVVDDKGTELMVKDSWRSKGRIPEWEFLKQVEGLEGVGQMVSWEEGKHTHEFRGQGVSGYTDFRDRVFVRIVMKAYGKSIDKFESKLQFLCAFRDAIAGHQNLLGRRILHRDVSVHNILIGAPGASKGNRGVLIDLDMAIFIDRIASLAATDFRTGTRMFQSISVLQSYESTNDATTPCHDYLDDIESFFYVFSFVCFGYSSPYQRLEVLPFDMDLWNDARPSVSRAIKCQFLLLLPMPPKTLDTLSEFWGPACKTLLKRFHTFLRATIGQKLELTSLSDSAGLEALRGKAGEHYSAVLKMFDDAIDEVTASPDDGYSLDTTGLLAFSGGPVCGPSRPIIPTALIPTASKRTSDEHLGDDSPLPKRQRQKTGALPFPSSLSHSLELEDEHAAH